MSSTHHPRERKVPPPLGDVDLVPSRRCTRLVGREPSGKEILCDQPATIHVDWGAHTGFICAEHEPDLKRWSSLDHHPLGPCCGMPGALWWWPPTSMCAFEDGGLPTTGPVAEEVTHA